MNKVGFAVTAVGVLAAILGVSCSATSGNGTSGSGVMAQGGGSTVGSGGAGATMQGSGGIFATSSGGDAILNIGGEITMPTTLTDGGKRCSVDVHQGERLPLDIYFLVDTSGSMNEKIQGGTKWSVVSGALVGFLNDPANSDIATGIAYFPKVLPGVPPFCTIDADCMAYGPCVDGIVSADGMTHLFGNCQKADACQVSEYSMPAVPLALPPNHGAVVTDIGRQNPGGGTPTQPALQGASAIAQQWAKQNPGRTTIIVLATDGDPTGCTTNTVQDVANVAAMTLAGSPSIKTYVIGVGNSLTSLNSIAQSGGSGQAFVLDTTGDVAKAFTAALNMIRGQAVPCDFKVPTETSSGKVDPTLVNVRFTPANGAPQVIPQTFDGTSGTCGPMGGWYYDNNAAPTLLKMCDVSCKALGLGGRVEVELGCQTEKAPPPR
jgi:hypothetical protein